MSELEIEKVQVFKVGDKLFNSEVEAKKHIVFMKNDRLLKYANQNNVINLLEEMVNQNITNKSRILSLVKHLKKYR